MRDADAEPGWDRQTDGRTDRPDRGTDQDNDGLNIRDRAPLTCVGKQFLLAIDAVHPDKKAEKTETERQTDTDREPGTETATDATTGAWHISHVLLDNFCSPWCLASRYKDRPTDRQTNRQTDRTTNGGQRETYSGHLSLSSHYGSE